LELHRNMISHCQCAIDQKDDTYAWLVRKVVGLFWVVVDGMNETPLDRNEDLGVLRFLRHRGLACQEFVEPRISCRLSFGNSATSPGL